jgi:predicted DNA repair protein MutK
MKALSVIGTAAMFMVGGGILVHGIPGSADFIHQAEQLAHGIPTIGGAFAVIAPTLLNALAGIIAGALVLLVITPLTNIFSKKNKTDEQHQ